MRPLILAVLLIAPLAARAAEPDPTQIALGQTLTETLGAMVQWRARALADEQRIGELQKQLAGAKPATTPAAPAKP